MTAEEIKMVTDLGTAACVTALAWIVFRYTPNFIKEKKKNT
jgi:hypothetical protein